MAHILHYPCEGYAIPHDADEYCPHCNHDIPVTIDESCQDDLEAVCPVCGHKLMLCTTLCECTQSCDWNEATGRCRMQRKTHMYFGDFGLLEWLEPADYFANPWRYYGTETGDDGKRYDIVISRHATEIRYTII